MMRYDGEERRRYARSRRQLAVNLDHGGPGLLNHVDNISASGVLCHTVKPVPLMTKVSIVMELPKPIERRVEGEGIVVRCDPHEQGDDHFKVAILFSRLSDDDREAVEKFVEYDLQETTAE